MAVDKLGIYNKALIKIGTSVLTTLTDDRDERHSLDACWNLNAVERCLEVIQPKFATTTTASTGAATTGGVTLAFTHDLPSDYVTLVGVYSDTELTQEVNRLVQDGNTIVCDYETLYIRYVQSGLAESTFTAGFVDVLSGYLAREICSTFQPDRYEEVAGALGALVEEVIGTEGAKEPESRTAKEGSALTAEWRVIYNKALLTLGKAPLPAGDTDHPYRVAMDTAVNAGVVSDVMEDTEWLFGLASNKLGYDTNIEPAWGAPYAMQLPTDLHRNVGIFIDDRFLTPLKDYVEQDGYIFSEYQELYIKYVSTDWLTQPAAWPTYFSQLIAARIAQDSAAFINPVKYPDAVEAYKEAKHSAKTNDAIQSPPQRIAGGNWLKVRGSYNSTTYGRGRP